MGVDKGRTRDMTAIALVAEGDDNELLTYVWFMLPTATVEEYKHLAKFEEWVACGDLEATPGNTADDHLVRAKIIDLVCQYRPQAMVYDEKFMDTIAQDVAAETGVEVIPFNQSLGRYAYPSAEFEKRVINGSLRHADQPVLNWQVGHVEVYCGPNETKKPVKPGKREDDVRKIDGVVAIIMALDAASRGVGSGPSVYESRGIMVL